MTRAANKLINETSPYLLQHAYNPVQWVAWNKETLKAALAADKPLLISVGYSACHWCHVMEHESFEDEAIATYMNTHFTCIKVDREERPDVDQLYMNTAHLTNGRGGWPLNCFALPDGRPFYATTYLPKERWLRLLENIVKEYQTDRIKLVSYANNIMYGLKQTNFIEPSSTAPQWEQTIEEAIDVWKQRLDPVHGGLNPPPKFPMPNSYSFLLKYASFTEDKSLQELAVAALDGMALGGIYDHIGGGITRYSVDGLWKLPHFEKMLYDNAQILSMYVEGYRLTKDLNYKHVLRSTIDYITKDFKEKDSGYFAAYDADSEGEEGRYYVWTEAELAQVLGNDMATFKALFYLDQNSFWEDEKHLVMRRPVQDVQDATAWSTEEVFGRLNDIVAKLKQYRDHRVKPGLDDKIITSWNALLVIGLVDAANALGDASIQHQAKDLLDWMLFNRLEGNTLHRIKKGKTQIQAFLDDYALLIQGLTAYGMHTGETAYLSKARDLLSYVIESFFHSDQGYFLYSQPEGDELVIQNVEYLDSVVPASNSVMCNNLIVLGRLFHEQKWIDMAQQMVESILPKVKQYPAGYSNWLNAAMMLQDTSFDVVVTGNNSDELFDALYQQLPPFNLLIKSNDEALPIAQHRTGQENGVYICSGNTCFAPETTVEATLETIKKAS